MTQSTSFALSGCQMRLSRGLTKPLPPTALSHSKRLNLYLPLPLLSILLSMLPHISRSYEDPRSHPVTQCQKIKQHGTSSCLSRNPCASQVLYWYQIAILAITFHNLYPLYNLLSTNCYFLVGIIMQVLGLELGMLLAHLKLRRKRLKTSELSMRRLFGSSIKHW